MTLIDKLDTLRHHGGPAITTGLPDDTLLEFARTDPRIEEAVDNALGLMGPDDRLTLALVPKGDWRHVSVRNTGTRLPDELQDQLFDSLVSVREPGADLHLGLGLHIVRLVAEAHGGSVEARNLPDDGGVAFTLHLPASGEAS